MCDVFEIITLSDEPLNFRCKVGAVFSSVGMSFLSALLIVMLKLCTVVFVMGMLFSVSMWRSDFCVCEGFPVSSLVINVGGSAAGLSEAHLCGNDD